MDICNNALHLGHVTQYNTTKYTLGVRLRGKDTLLIQLENPEHASHCYNSMHLERIFGKKKACLTPKSSQLLAIGMLNKGR
jgi:hypothetical protein